MKPIAVNTMVELEPREIAKACSPEDLGSLFCYLTESIARSSPTTFAQRRKLIGEIADSLHEDALCMLGEVLALAYQRARRDASTAPHP